MSRGHIKKQRESSPMPATSAGLLRFYEEESFGIKIRPEVVVAMAIIMTVVVALAPILLR